MLRCNDVITDAAKVAGNTSKPVSREKEAKGVREAEMAVAGVTKAEVAGSQGSWACHLPIIEEGDLS